jgi:tRNA pseudouridine38-40 synthase
VSRFKLTVEYAGTRYSGWQIQKNARTVQGEIDQAIRNATGRSDFELYGAGRTDAGVHAVGQVAHLDIYTSIKPGALRHQLNDRLPSDIGIVRVDGVPHRFHARHDAVSRSYLYQIARRKTALFKPYVWWIKEPLDIDRMRQAAASFIGLQDFASFTADEPDQKSTRVMVEALEIGEDGDLILIRVVGSHFLWRMVRRVTGVLTAVGRGELTPEQSASLLEDRSDVPATLTAPASGLFLEGVYYRGEDGPGALKAVVRLARG